MTTAWHRARRAAVSAPLLAWFRRRLPAMSQTERAAIEAGTVGWDAELFGGRPRWERLLDPPAPALSEAEQAFLAGPLEELCARLDDWEIRHRRRDLPPEVWAFLGRHRFFGLVIPEAEGGLGFSALAHSAVVMKLAARSLTAAVTVMVPNALGPAELLLRYGTAHQRAHYLPRLADGRELPCFALTGPDNGSDAAAMPDRGVVCRDADGTLGFRISWNKRYITLGPVATLIALAFRAADPQRLLGGETELGITLALVPADAPGVEVGRRHFPAGQAFQNGPIRGHEVFVPLEQVIGGREGIGHGWRMIMECLAAGRGISLPAVATGAVKLCARTAGAYARVRRQFGRPIADFEGIKEPLGRIAANAYTLEALRRVTAGAVDRGERPAVLSAIAKHAATVRMRESIDDAMEVHGGRAICDGPANYLANAYYAVPVALTVEGANILTRSMIVFGQGIVRCHPWLRHELDAAAAADNDDADPQAALVRFDAALWGHLGHQLATLARALAHGLTVGRLVPAPEAGPARPYYRALGRLSTGFALLAEAALLSLGGSLKRREGLCGRFADVLGEMYLVSCCLRRFEDDGRPEADLPLLRLACERGLEHAERKLDEILANLPARPLAWSLRRVIFPYGRRRRPPSDRLLHACADLITRPSPARERLSEGLPSETGEEDAIAQLEAAFTAAWAAEPARRKLARAGQRDVEAALAAGAIDAGEAERITEAERRARAAIRVDDFDPEELTGERPRIPPAERLVATST